MDYTKLSNQKKKAFFNSFLRNPPKTDAELDAFIQIYFGLKIPNKVITPGHVSPFQFISDLFFERVRQAIGFANRTGGKTFNVYLLSLLYMLFKPGCTITGAGAVEEQALTGYAHVSNWCKNNEWVKSQVDGKPSVKETRFINMARLKIITATINGFNSPHPHKSIIDEVELLDPDLLEEAYSMAKSERDRSIMAQDILISTRKTMTGLMQKIIAEAPKKKFQIYKWNIWEVLEKCTLQIKCVDCDLFKVCEGRAKECDGYYLIDDLIDKYVKMSDNVFRAQWLCDKPELKGLFYQDFREETHVISKESFAEKYNTKVKDDPVEMIPPGWPKFLAIDWGFTVPTAWAIGALDQTRNILYIVKEFYDDRYTATNSAKAFKGEYLIGGYNWNKWKYDFIVGDPANADARATWNQEGVKVRNADNDREKGFRCVLDRMKFQKEINSPRIVFLAGCDNFIWEHQYLKVKPNNDDALKKDDHAVDAVRYMAIEVDKRYTRRRLGLGEAHESEVEKPLHAF